MFKNLLIVFLVLIIIGLSFFLYFSLKGKEARGDLESVTRGEVKETADTSSPLDSQEIEKLIKSAELIVPETNYKVKLKNGEASFNDGQVSGDVVVVSVLGQRKRGEGHDVWVDVAESSGGTGIFHYLALFEASPQEAKYLSSKFLGDRIKVLSATSEPESGENYTLIVRYLDRKEGEPMVADPSVEKEASFQVAGGGIQ